MSLKRIKLIFINAFVFAVLLLLVDPLIKSDFALTPETTRSIVLREFHPNLNIEFKNRQQVQYNSNAKLKTIKIKTDKDGFLTNSQQANQDKVDIIFFGGSTTASLYVDEQYRWTALVQNNLSTELERQVNVINSSLSGNNSMHSNLALISKGIERSPKVAVIMNVINDIGLLTKTNSYFDVPTSRSIIKNKNLDDNEKENYNKLYYIFRNTLKNIYPNLYGFIRDRILGYNFTIRNDEFSNYRQVEINKDAVLEEYSKSINLFLSICNTYKIKPVLMTQFNLFNNFEYVKKYEYDTYPEDEQLLRFIDTYNSANSLIREIAEKQGVDLIDLDKLVPKSIDNFVDLVHLTNNGSKIVSDIVSENLINLIK